MDVKKGKGTNGTNLEPEGSYVQCSNTYDEFKNTTTMPPHEEEPATKQDEDPTPKHTTIATKEEQPQPELTPAEKQTKKCNN